MISIQHTPSIGEGERSFMLPHDRITHQRQHFRDMGHHLHERRIVIERFLDNGFPSSIHTINTFLLLGLTDVTYY
jgi:hypothetical protein